MAALITLCAQPPNPSSPRNPSSSPLSHRHVVYTTPAHYAPSLERRLRAHQAHPLWLPTISVLSTPHTKTLIRNHLQKTLINQSSAIAFTSRAAINSFSEALSEILTLNGPPLSGEGEPFYLCALGRDSELLDQRFVLSLCENLDRVRVFVPSVPTPKAMAEELGDGLNREILCLVPLVTGLDEPSVVPDFLGALKDQNWRPIRLNSYETRWAGLDCAEFLISDEASDAIVFTSTAEVQGLIKGLKKLGFEWVMVREKRPGLVVAAHGPVTALGAKKLGVDIDLVSSRFDSFDGVVNALAQRFMKGGQP
ncbi:hypothetical protein AMTRI_Chr03g137950 [Amborella trichopoda]|uniref:Tetrapyrrole biosynthesis uroporphyrinogen III synthase domain-containing protein n=1 Tax=Amborella trichopoda TaxID=13333 RepID=W1PTQ4_AMBTC|nr:uncharacterized protein LOC18439632 [Amborella trichopoda]XP_020526312.1 uncharacterized protein LOC18439632 [Amborella trichopoda]ERN11438.1 hypothetical protein AMTR_s00022p00059330 [Amborella trichopoda]|eukprot:XP_006849857.1 uncharacterized protein LOC18439632 [Amborella trichopoda]